MRKQNALLSLILALVMALSLLAGCSELIRELYQVESKILEDPETGQRAISYF